MQGNLSEIDIRSILQLIELGQRTGELFVEAYPSAWSYDGGDRNGGATASDPGATQHWFVFFLNGQIVYAADTESSLGRLSDYLRRYRIEQALPEVTNSTIAATNAPEYGYLWMLLEKHLLTPEQGRSIIQGMVHETLFDLLSLHQGEFIFELGPPLAPQLTTLAISPLLAKIIKQAQQWKQLSPHIQSPDQCPMISHPEALRAILPQERLQMLEQYTDGKTSIRQIARYLNRDSLTVGRALYPHIQKGVIQMLHPPTEMGKAYPSHRAYPTWEQSSPAPPLHVVCIDDGVTVRTTVETILSQHDYRVTSLENPLDALGAMFRLKPDLILCDIAMPELDGYEICAMLRRSTQFRQTPIVMLTGKDGFIDRVRARMVGATDYLTKPFGESELLMLVEKYAKSGVFKRHPSTNSWSIPPKME